MKTRRHSAWHLKLRSVWHAILSGGELFLLFFTDYHPPTDTMQRYPTTDPSTPVMLI